MEAFTEINIKGMVCNRCIQAIKEKLLAINFPPKHISLGKVIFPIPISITQKDQIREQLSILGFSLISDKNEQLILDIKSLISKKLSDDKLEEKEENLSVFLSKNLGKSYDYLSDFFSRYEGQTIEKYYIEKRMDKVKELLAYSEFTLSEIAYRIGFSSMHHLSAQVKKITGFSPSEIRSKKRD